MTRDVLYFAYGTLQEGFSNHAAMATELGGRLGRYRTREPYPLAVTTRPACTNPGCRLVHHMCALLPDAGDGLAVEGDVYAIEAATLERLDRLESYAPEDPAGSTYLRRLVAVEGLDGGPPLEAHAYFVADARQWREMVADGRAVVRRRYTLELAEGPLKPCCRLDPAHEGPHDVIAPF